MTTFTFSQIPPNIVTLEQLHMWSGHAIRALSGASEVVEADGLLPERVAQCPVIQTPNYGVRTIIRVNLELDPAYASDNSKKFWMFAKELTLGNLPNGNWTTN